MGAAARLLGRPILVRLASLSLLSGLTAIVIVLALYRPGELEWSPACIWWSLTGLRCPGCGLTRGLSALLHGEVVDAIWLNPFILVVPPLFLGIAAFAMIGLVKGRFPILAETPRFVGWALFALLAGFWLYRTIVDLWSQLAA